MVLKQLIIEDDIRWEEFDQEYLPTNIFNKFYKLQEFDKRLYRKLFEPIILTKEGYDNLVKQYGQDEVNSMFST